MPQSKDKICKHLAFVCYWKSILEFNPSFAAQVGFDAIHKVANLLT